MSPRPAAQSSWSEARDVAFGAATALPPVLVPLADAASRVLAAPVLALCDVPHYASSAMDGWAVCSTGPWRLLTGGDAGLIHHEASAIVTGGLIPKGCDAVLRSEAGDVEFIDGSPLLVAHDSAEAPWLGQHIRPSGEEFRRGDVAIEAGVLLNPAHIAVAAACGIDEVAVAPRARVALILTGDEVVTHGIPGPGRVRDSFGPQLPTFVRLLGGQVVRQQRLLDDRAALIAALGDDPAGCELVITTGGTGTSSADHLRSALTAVGASILVGGVAMRPGAPSLLARLVDGRLLVALPGNPLAAMMGLLTLAQPVLTALAGGAGPAKLTTVTLASDVPEGRGATRLIPFRQTPTGAVATAFTGSAMLRGLAEASGVLVCGPSGAHVGATVSALVLPWA